MAKYKVTLHRDMAFLTIVEADTKAAAIQQVMQQSKKIGLESMVMLGEHAEADIAAEDVAFRVTGSGEVIALFSGYLPDENDQYPAYTLAKGQFNCDFADIYDKSREATPEEYAKLKKHMEDNGYVLHVMSAEEAKEAVEDYNETDDNIVETQYGKVSIVYRDEGYGGYFDVYVKSNDKVERYDLLIGSVNDNEDESVMMREVEELLIEYSKTQM